jgi:serine protease Do
MKPPTIMDEKHKEPEDQENIQDEWTEADFLDDEEEKLEPPAYQIWMKRAMLALVALALVGNLFAIIPMIFNLNVIQFLKKTNELSQDEALQKYKQAIVIVQTVDSKGTGFNIDPGGVIVTNAHVVDQAATAVIGFEDGQTFRARVLIRDEELDLAVLQVENPPKASLPLLEMDTDPDYSEDAQVYYIGNPYFYHHIIGEGSIHGLIESSSRSSPVLALNAPIYKGNSGSPVLNVAGQVIAVVYATSQVSVGNDWKKVGLSVPIYELWKIWPQPK